MVKNQLLFMKLAKNKNKKNFFYSKNWSFLNSNFVKKTV